MTALSRRQFVLLAGGGLFFTLGIARVRAQSKILVRDAASLRRALEEVRVRGGGIVELPVGEIKVSAHKGAAIVLPNGTVLKGQGRGQTRIVMTNDEVGHVISAPEGGVKLIDFTVDGGANQRRVSRGHNIRLEGDDNLVQRISSINSCSYGVALGQRRFVRRCVLEDVVVVDAKDDGVDVKNRLGRTEVTIRNIRISRKGTLDADGSKAALDLRGKCLVEDVDISDMGSRRGLRFRQGESGEQNGPGAHGSIARRVRVRGAAYGIVVQARDVELSEIETNETSVGIALGAENLVARSGFVRGANCLTIIENAARISARFSNIRFHGALSPNAAKHDLQFKDCVFE